MDDTNNEMEGTRREKNKEKTDRAAKLAISDGIPYRCLPVHSEVLGKVRRCRQVWKEYFDERSLTKGIWYRTVQCQPPHVPWFDKRLSRKRVVALLRLRSGHIPSNKFKHLMRLAVSPNCPECNKVEDVHHVLTECVRNEALRSDMSWHNSNNMGSCNIFLASPLSDDVQFIFKNNVVVEVIL